MITPLFFNTAGPNEPESNYCVDPLSRLDMEELVLLVDQAKYFVLHAPRQTGKTTCLKAFVDYLHKEGRYRACYFNVEAGQASRDNKEEAFRVILSQIASRADDAESPRLLEFIKPILSGEYPAVSGFSELLQYWSKLDPRPLVLMIDEADALIGDTLISLLRQLRAGYDKRRQHAFPWSVILCGIRDVRDYRLYSLADKTIVTGGSVFNIRSESLRLGDFDRAQVENLLNQHTVATGQIFLPDAIEAIWQLTQGQPWLVNALAYQACFKDKRGRDRSRPIDLPSIEDAKEALILRRDTHLDQLADKLREERVRRVVQPILLSDGSSEEAFVDLDDLQYCIDLGLIRQTPEGPAIANPIYREVVPRELTSDTQEFLKARFKLNWVRADGSLDITKLIAEFQEFYQENGEIWASRFAYQEAGPQLLLQAFLQRVINGQGRIEREYALGTGRTDLFLRWPNSSGIQKVVFELKVLRKGIERTIVDGLKQISSYADRCGASETHLLIFMRNQNIPIEQRAFRRNENFDGRIVSVWGL